ncbi:unnamed protein product, partial [Mesorhabditis spiculigera]
MSISGVYDYEKPRKNAMTQPENAKRQIKGLKMRPNNSAKSPNDYRPRFNPQVPICTAGSQKRGGYLLENGGRILNGQQQQQQYRHSNTIQNIDESPSAASSEPRPNGHTHQHEEEPVVVEEASCMVGAEGGVVTCPGSRVELRIPAGALPIGQKHEIYVRVCQEGSVLPPIDPSRGETLLSPLVICGPQGLQFNKPAELRLPHNGSVSNDQWQFSLKTGDGGRWTNVDIDKNTGMASQEFLSVPIHSF